MRCIPRFCMFALVLATLSLAAQTPPPSAEQVLSKAKSQASDQHKNIFLIFDASW